MFSIYRMFFLAVKKVEIINSNLPQIPTIQLKNFQ